MTDQNCLSQILYEYAEEREKRTTFEFHYQLKGAILDAVDEGLISCDPTRKVIIKGKTPKAKRIKYLSRFELHMLLLLTLIIQMIRLAKRKSDI